jgi:hypothetical protein
MLRWQVQQEYGFPFMRSAKALQQRASDMLHKGFEWALRFGEPRPLRPKQYRQQQPCCNVTMNRQNVLMCAHPWDNRVELPFGDPRSGAEWQRGYPDPGTYEGGTYSDAPQL